MARQNWKARKHAATEGRSGRHRDAQVVPVSRPELHLPMPPGEHPVAPAAPAAPPLLVDVVEDIGAEFLVTDELACRMEIGKEATCCACGGVYSQRLDGSSFCRNVS